MGTYYSLGIISEFVAESEKTLTQAEWEQLLTKRLDLSLFQLTIHDNKIYGSLYPEIFKENIKDFYQILKEIAGPNRSENIDYYEKKFGSNLDDYHYSGTVLFVEGSDGSLIKIGVRFALLFVEGKVSVEIFNTEPHLINWLFRNSKIENKLAGCVISEIV
ncbi:hypothetical protein HNQ34_002989 [Anoxybacillus tepidamans]|uniref:Uncharacterized protein n=1 Tax=Anoxybacteroides tepidamans TaxID=265948 RepID=A0A7W8ISF8_9BACL|nr:hypothetical protein [Anoxybacillus tepidamans]MBB5325883.1 hypothetical protein [Anoxybacillus tepidamans]